MTIQLGKLYKSNRGVMYKLLCAGLDRFTHEPYVVLQDVITHQVTRVDVIDFLGKVNSEEDTYQYTEVS